MIVTDGLVGYWNSKAGVNGATWENIAPSTKGKYNGTITNAIVNEDGMYFDGSSYVDFPTPEEVDRYGDTTVELRMKIENGSVSPDVLTTNGYVLLWGTETKLEVDKMFSLGTEFPIDTSQEIYFSISYDTVNLKGNIYINNALTHTVDLASNGEFSYGFADFRLGSSNAQYQPVGVIDNLRIYNRVLSEEERTQNYETKTDVGVSLLPSDVRFRVYDNGDFEIKGELVTPHGEMVKKKDIDALNEQLAQTEQKLMSDLAHTATKDELQQISLAYKESYATLTALQTAYPTGDEHNHAVLSDGMIYTWVNSTWTNTQIQANGTGIANKTITIEKINGATYDNMFDSSTATTGKYVNNSGAVLDSSVLSLSDFIPVEEGKSYIVPVGYTSQGGYYNSNKTWVSRVENHGGAGEVSNWVFTVPAGVTYVRLNLRTSLLNTWMMVEGTTYPSEYKPYGASVKWLNLDFKINKALENVISPSKWTGKTIVTFGDSITWYDGQPYNANTKEPGIIVKGYQSYMREQLGANVINQGKSGYTTSQIKIVIQGYDFTGVDAVTILAGTNDFRDIATKVFGDIQPIGSTFDTSTYVGAYQQSIEHILGQNPEIKIYLFTQVKAWKDDYGLMPETYPQVVKDLGKLYSLSVCDLYYESGINDLTKGVYMVDGDSVAYDFHPSTKGYERMANIIVPFLENH
jgi:lysophospholipase L1-like esterase